MIIRRGGGDLNKIYRPCTIKEMIGNQTIRNMITTGIEKGTLPHGPYYCFRFKLW
jgi:hypothetical protein